MLASKSFALNATAGAASQRVQIVLPTRAVSLATCNQCRGLQQHAQLMLVPRPAHGEAAAQRLRAAAVAGGWFQSGGQNQAARSSWSGT